MSSRRRRILWVGKSATNGMTGDEVFDRKTLAAWAQGCVSAIADLPAADLRERFVRFQHACARYFTWDAVARKLLEAADTAIEAGSRNDRRALLQSPLQADTQNEERFFRLAARRTGLSA